MKELFLLIAVISFSVVYAAGQSVNLAEQLMSKKLTVVNRKISASQSNAVELNARVGDGLIILNSVALRTGTISIELQGENNPGRSFIGLAFNIQNDSTYEAVYFRPFNFIAEESVRRIHMSQYISHPTYTWHKLRKERTGEFEGEIIKAPDPDNWFTALIKITEDRVKVYINDNETAALDVVRLATVNSNRIGLWTGNNSSGRFRNLILIE